MVKINIALEHAKLCHINKTQNTEAATTDDHGASTDDETLLVKSEGNENATLEEGSNLNLVIKKTQKHQKNLKNTKNSKNTKTFEEKRGKF